MVMTKKISKISSTFRGSLLVVGLHQIAQFSYVEAHGWSQKGSYDTEPHEVCMRELNSRYIGGRETQTQSTAAPQMPRTARRWMRCLIAKTDSEPCGESA